MKDSLTGPDKAQGHFSMKKQDKKTKQYAGNNGHLWDGKKKCPAGLKK